MSPASTHACPRPPPKTLPRERLQNWESKVGATSSINPHPADPFPLLSRVSPRGQGWGQGYFGPERWSSGRERVGNPELPPASRGEDPASPQSSRSPSFLLGNLMCNLPANEAQDCNFQPWGTCPRICFLSLGRQMKRQTRARRAPEFTAPPTLLQDPHPARSHVAFLPSLGC